MFTWSTEHWQSYNAIQFTAGIGIGRFESLRAGFAVRVTVALCSRGVKVFMRQPGDRSEEGRQAALDTACCQRRLSSF